ncbi:MAG: M20/M25/M40 family metallo-hydrolase [Planctomycetota bacterium]|jgi:glutamate carboxypeptidase
MRNAILDCLKKLVDCSSYSHNHQGIFEAGKIAASYMPKCFSEEVIESDTTGPHRIFRHKASAKNPIILAGHIDTLCPYEKDFSSLEDKGDTLCGPGVNDMKGGDTVMIWALRILENMGKLSDLPFTCILNGDEEIGSPDSSRLFKAEQDKAKAALVFECGGPEGTLVTTRKGIHKKRVCITGKAAQFGNLKEKKVSAIEELAYKVTKIESLNESEKDIAANVGKISGGIAANKVAEYAEFDFEYRSWDPQTLSETETVIDNILKTSKVENCTCTTQNLSHRPPMVPTADSLKIFNKAVAIGRDMGENIIEEKRGGVSDACWLSHVGIPTVDGLGPLGDGDFTRDEYIIKDTLFSRIELTVRLLLEISEFC